MSGRCKTHGPARAPGSWKCIVHRPARAVRAFRPLLCGTHRSSTGSRPVPRFHSDRRVPLKPPIIRQGPLLQNQVREILDRFRVFLQVRAGLKPGNGLRPYPEPDTVHFHAGSPAGKRSGRGFSAVLNPVVPTRNAHCVSSVLPDRSSAVRFRFSRSRTSSATVLQTATTREM